MTYARVLGDRDCATCGRGFRPRRAIRLFCSRTCANSRQHSLDELFWRNVDSSAGLLGCWPWQGAVDRHGYGRVTVGGRTAARRSVYAHRIALVLDGRPAAADQEALHSCDNPPCVNPAHLRPGSHADNMRDAQERGRFRGTVIRAA